MPTWSSISAFEREIADFQRKLEREYAREIAFQSAKRGQRIAREAAAADLGGDPKFSGWKPRLATVIKQKPDGRAFLIPTKTSAGPWTVAEFGRNSAFGPAQLQSGRRQRVLKSGRLSTARGTRRRYNGQTAGKDTATDATTRMGSEIPPEVERLFKRQLERHFDVT
jgi:hypothetical protein